MSSRNVPNSRDSDAPSIAGGFRALTLIIFRKNPGRKRQGNGENAIFQEIATGLKSIFERTNRAPGPVADSLLLPAVEYHSMTSAETIRARGERSR